MNVRDVIAFCDGIEDASHPELARRTRSLARDYARLQRELDAERSARVAIQAQLEVALKILGEHADRAAAAAAAAGVGDRVAWPEAS
jgi:hypothetical protein